MAAALPRMRYTEMRDALCSGGGLAIGGLGVGAGAGAGAGAGGALRPRSSAGAGSGGAHPSPTQSALSNTASALSGGGLRMQLHDGRSSVGPGLHSARHRHRHHRSREGGGGGATTPRHHHSRAAAAAAAPSSQLKSASTTGMVGGRSRGLSRNYTSAPVVVDAGEGLDAAAAADGWGADVAEGVPASLARFVESTRSHDGFLDASLSRPRTVGGGGWLAPGPVSQAFPSWNWSTLTEIYLCHACSHHEIEDEKRPGRGGGRSRPRPARRPRRRNGRGSSSRHRGP
jgi:hypothetical protein